jgi:DNA gyrase/topoisomerase IV subunit B
MRVRCIRRYVTCEAEEEGHADPQLSQLEHVLKRPDSYIGSVEAITQMMWVYDEATKMMVNR